MHDQRLKDIVPFVASVDTGSFAAAAQRLHVTGSAVSKSVTRLEARLGSQLLERSTRRLRLTDAGTAYYQTCLRVMEELAEAEAVLTAQRTIPSGKLRLAVPSTFGRLAVMPALIPFCRQFPDVQLNLTFSDRFIDLFDEGIDVAVRIGGTSELPAGLGSRVVGREHMVFCAAPAYLAAQGEPDSLDALRLHPAILYERADGTPKPWSLLDDQGEAHWRTVPHRLALGDVDAQLQAVCAGLGVAQMPTWLIRDALSAGTLQQILPAQQVDGLPLSLIWPRRKQLLPKVDALLNALADVRIR